MNSRNPRVQTEPKHVLQNRCSWLKLLRRLHHFEDLLRLLVLHELGGPPEAGEPKVASVRTPCSEVRSQGAGALQGNPAL